MATSCLMTFLAYKIKLKKTNERIVWYNAFIIRYLSLFCGNKRQSVNNPFELTF
ncbi:MAG: hypothetical protein H6Q17_102 [Bacteroidetes bacterium]|nr:hypothetical protein [Bacteroidota bacterium]